MSIAPAIATWRDTILSSRDRLPECGYGFRPVATNRDRHKGHRPEPGFRVEGSSPVRHAGARSGRRRAGKPEGVLEMRHFRKRGDPPAPPRGQTGEKATKRWLEHASSVNDAAQWMPDTTVVVLCGRESGFSGFLSLASRLPNVKGLLGAKIDREAAGEKDPLFPLPAWSDECANMTVKVPRGRSSRRRQGRRQGWRRRQGRLNWPWKDLSGS